jgi:hypothetical protein
MITVSGQDDDEDGGMSLRSSNADGGMSLESLIENVDPPVDVNISLVQNAPIRIRSYPTDHKGPYIVFIKERGAALAHITISKRINETFKGSVKSLVRVAKSKIRVELVSARVANEVLKAQFLGIYLTYIPAESVEVDGVVNLETGYDLKDLVANGTGKFTNPRVPPTKVVHAFRFRRVKSDVGATKEFEDTEAVRVTFSGTALPRWLLIHGLLIPVRLFSPKLMTCVKCLGDHHTAKHCTTGQRCLKCNKNHLTTECTDTTPWCSHCRKNVVHDTKEDCEAFFVRTQKLMNSVRKSSRKSYAEAVRMADTNLFSILQNEETDQDDARPSTSGIKFPKLPPPSGKMNSGLAANERGGKRSRQRSESPTEALEDFFGRENVEHFLGSESRERREPETKRRNRRRNTTNGGSKVGGDQNMSSNSIKEHLASFISSLGLSPATCSIANLIVSSLVDLFWPSLSSFLSKIFGSTSSHNRSGNHIHG